MKKTFIKWIHCLLSHLHPGIKPYYPLVFVAAIANFFLLVPLASESNPNPSQKTVIKYIETVKPSPTKYPKMLVFIADKGNRGKGKLLAINTKEAKIEGEFKAVSGVGGRENQVMRGPIPSTRKVKIARYGVRTDPLILSNLGIAGEFYQIDPFWVDVDGTKRGDFGIHFDANVPGTAGCVGISDRQEWEAFKKLMKAFREAGLSEIPLIVAYH